MKNKIYNSPEISVLDVELNDVITTSDPTLGTESPIIGEEGGTFEVL